MAMNSRLFGGFEDFFVSKYIDDGILFAVTDFYRIDRKRAFPNQSEERLVGTFCVVRGEMSVRSDVGTVVCNARQNNLLFIDPSTLILSIDTSPDFKCYVLLFNRFFMLNNINTIGLTPKLMPQNAQTPFYTICDQDRQTLVADYNRIEQYFERESHRFYHQTIRLTVLDTLCDTINIICNCNPMMTFEHPMRGRRDEICRHFMDLISENVRARHDVAYYADRLCITPQYLTKVTKSKFGRTAGQMIDMSLMREATIMLHSSDMSIGDVADRLSFADTASFSKFFRKHQNVSPARYRRSL